MPTKNKLALNQQRAEQVNQAIHIIDDYIGKRIFIHETVWGGKWRGFISHGGTLKETRILTYVLTYKKTWLVVVFNRTRWNEKEAEASLFNAERKYHAQKSATQ
jgi:hypothetical protein